MIDAITGYCGRINVFQQEGEGGIAYVNGTVFVDRVPRGMGGEGVSLQWLGIRAYDEPIYPRPSPDHFECRYIGHLETHESSWTHRDNFGVDSRKRNGLRSYCDKCQAAYEARLRKRAEVEKMMILSRIS